MQRSSVRWCGILCNDEAVLPLHVLASSSHQPHPSPAAVSGFRTLSGSQGWQQRAAELQGEAAAASQATETAKAAAAKLRRDQENERERVKKVMGDMKKKLDRH